MTNTAGASGSSRASMKKLLRPALFMTPIRLSNTRSLDSAHSLNGQYRGDILRGLAMLCGRDLVPGVDGPRGRRGASAPERPGNRARGARRHLRVVPVPRGD